MHTAKIKQNLQQDVSPIQYQNDKMIFKPEQTQLYTLMNSWSPSTAINALPETLLNYR
jgi:hypothetical protein